MKELLKVTVLKDAICSAEIHCETQHEKVMLASSLLSLMDKDEEFAKILIRNSFLYMSLRKKVSETNAEAIRSAEIKTKN
jgi:hypothetical protein